MKLPSSQNLSLSKRRKFAISALLLSLLLLGAILSATIWRYRFIGAMTLVSIILTAWSLSDGYKGISRIITSVFSLMFATGAGMFTFLLPDIITEFWIFPLLPPWTGIFAWSLKVIFWILFAIGFYSLLLTENIFAVSTIRTIQLARAAGAVGFMLILVTAFFGFDTLLSFRLTYYWNFLITFLISLPLFFTGLWSVKLEEKINIKILIPSLVMSFALGQLALSLSFWPVSVTVGSLALTTGIYVLLGLYQQELIKRMFKKTVFEYTSVGVLVFLIILFTANWGG